jgi:hypothetical protein
METEDTYINGGDSWKAGSENGFLCLIAKKQKELSLIREGKITTKTMNTNTNKSV